MRFAGALRNILRPLSLSSSTPLTSQISTTLPFHAPFPSYSKPPQFLLPFLNHFHTLTDTRFPKRRPSDKPRRKRASLRPSGPYAWVEHTTGETILPNKPNEGSVKRRNEKKRMRQRPSARVKSSGAKKTVARNKPTTKYRSCLRTFLEMTDIPTGGVRTVHIEVGIFGFDYDQMIGNEDFMQVFSHEEIGVIVVNTYIRFLYDKLMRPNGLDVSFGFLAPATVNLGLILSRPDTVTEYVLRILMDNKDAEKLFFIPFNTGGHWLLLAINPIREIVYYLDSLGNDWTTYPDMKVLIDTVLQAFRAQRDIQTSRRGANSITWIKVACPQQRNQIDCGYFMLRFMRDTLALGRLKIPTDYFDEFKCAFYTKDQVDEIKEEWCQFMIKLNVCS
ncbi:hypothetical protein KIW84_024784 [Lathyrus oleraceus]|uniref:Ubiquitin-like protease family profile domain-containing protein n=1 Tax=Pisum sativum TaxID=3888 RepID=A0A9D4YHC5_PEA|nr:hypothetical protein KIW84_024784 [Pisum sativum]